MVKKKVLGKGLGALIPGLAEEHIHEVDIPLILPNPFQPRLKFDEEEINSLAETIKEKGLLQPVLLRKKGNSYEVISGERRVRAAKLAGLKKIPAIIKDVSDSEMLEITLIENLQREELNPLEEARGYLTLMKEFGLTQEEVAKKVGKSRSAIANTMRLLKLPEEIQKAILEEKISEGHARALLSIKDEKLMLAEFRKLLKEKKSVRELESIRKSKDPNIEALERKIMKETGLKVELKHGKKGGRLIFYYKKIEEIESLLKSLGIKVEAIY